MANDKQELEKDMWKLKLNALSTLLALDILLQMDKSEMKALMPNTPHGQIYGLYASETTCLENMKDAITRMLKNDFITCIDCENNVLRDKKAITAEIHNRLRNLYK